MNILDRVRLAMIDRQISRLQSADRLERDQMQTTADMVRHMNQRAKRIVELRAQKLRIEGGEDIDDPATEFGDTRIPSDFGIPSKQEREP